MEVEKSEILINRINNFEYYFGNSNRIGIQHVIKALTFKNPDPYAYCDLIEKFNRNKLTFKIGMISTLKKYVVKNNLNGRIVDFKYSLPEGTVIDSRMSGNYIHQRNAVEAFYKRRFGIIVVPTRGGKTFIASEILRIFLNNEKGNFLFVVDNTTLFNQAKNDIKEYFETYGGIEIGEIKSGKIDLTKRVTVGMIQSIQSIFSARCTDKNKKKDITKFFKTLIFLCVDEIHDNCSKTRLRIYKKAVGLNYLLCLSATPYKAGTLLQNLNLQEWSGDVVYTITDQVLRERNVLSDYRTIMLMIDHNLIKYKLRDRDYNDYKRAFIYESKFRNGVLMKVINILKELKLKTLVLFQSIDHGVKIGELTGIPFISGVSSNDEREREKREFLEGEGGFLLASNIFKKGVTLPEVKVLINADGGLEDANTTQRGGRVMGATATKNKSLIIDFFDLYYLYFSKHSEARLNNYVNSIGEKGVNILETKKDCWEKIFKNDVAKWFKKETCTDIQ